MAGVQEENRRRIALSLLGLGGFLILAGVGLWMYNQHSIHTSQALAEMPRRGTSKLDKEVQVRVIQQVLFYLLILVGILTVSLYAFKIWSRRFRQALFRKPAPPTPSEDVWAMHQLPVELLTEGASPDNVPPDKEI